MSNPIVAFIGICAGVYALIIAFYAVVMIIAVLCSTIYTWGPILLCAIILYALFGDSK